MDLSKEVAHLEGNDHILLFNAGLVHVYMPAEDQFLTWQFSELA